MLRRMMVAMLVGLAAGWLAPLAAQTCTTTATATGGGFFAVYVNGAKVSQHSAERKAQERAGNESRADSLASVVYNHEGYQVRVVSSGCWGSTAPAPVDTATVPDPVPPPADSTPVEPAPVDPPPTTTLGPASALQWCGVGCEQLSWAAGHNAVFHVITVNGAKVGDVEMPTTSFTLPTGTAGTVCVVAKIDPATSAEPACITSNLPDPPPGGLVLDTLVVYPQGVGMPVGSTVQMYAALGLTNDARPYVCDGGLYKEALLLSTGRGAWVEGSYAIADTLAAVLTMKPDSLVLRPGGNVAGPCP